MALSVFFLLCAKAGIDQCFPKWVTLTGVAVVSIQAVVLSVCHVIKENFSKRADDFLFFPKKGAVNQRN